MRGLESTHSGHTVRTTEKTIARTLENGVVLVRQILVQNRQVAGFIKG